jgi:hypothetical protein
VYDRPEDIPMLLDRIIAFHDGLKGADAITNPVEAYARAMDLTDVLASHEKFERAVTQDSTQADGKAGMKHLAVLKAYYDKWVA